MRRSTPSYLTITDDEEVNLVTITDDEEDELCHQDCIDLRAILEN